MIRWKKVTHNLTFVLKGSTLAGKMGSFKEDIERILARKKQEETVTALRVSNESAYQDSLKKEFDAEVEQLKIATETTVLPLLETVGEKIGRKPLLKCSLPFKSLPAEVHGYIENYEKSQEGIRRKAQEKAYGKTKDGRLDDILTGRIFYEYPSIQVTLTFRDEVTRSHWEADDLISPAEYLNVSCIRKQEKNYATVTIDRGGAITTVGSSDFTDTKKLEKYILSAFDRLS